MASKSFGLGRGLGSLIPQKETKDVVSTSTGTTASVSHDEVAPVQVAPSKKSVADGHHVLTMISLDHIDANPYQPRAEFDEDALSELAESIKEHGVLQPLVVQPNGDRYELIAGERRLRASQKAGLREVPAVVRPALSSDKKLSLALIENIQRKDLSVIEEAHSYQQLMDEFGYTQELVAKAVGKPRATVANILRLLQLPAQVQAALATGTITLGHAKVLLSMEDVRKQLTLFQRIVDEHLTVRQAEAAVRVMDTKVVARKQESNSKDPEIVSVENQLRSALGAKVEVQAHGGQGRIVVSFFSPDELIALKQKLLNK